MRAIFRKLAQDVPAMLGLGIVLFVLLLALFGPWLAPYPEDASASHLLRRLKPPSADPYGHAGAGAGNELVAEKLPHPPPSDWFDGL